MGFMDDDEATQRADVAVGIGLATLAIPGAVCVASVVVALQSGGQARPGLLFLLVFAGAAFCQVSILLMAADRLVTRIWQRGLDPDNAAIPYVTALGDLVGTI